MSGNKVSEIVETFLSGSQPTSEKINTLKNIRFTKKDKIAVFDLLKTKVMDDRRLKSYLEYKEIMTLIIHFSTFQESDYLDPEAVSLRVARWVTEGRLPNPVVVEAPYFLPHLLEVIGLAKQKIEKYSS